MTDDEGRPRVLLLSPGNINDIAPAPALLAAAGPIKIKHRRKRSSLRRPAEASRLYRPRNLIERMFARIKDCRRIAARYDKLARNFLAGALIAAGRLVAQLSPDPSWFEVALRSNE